MNGCAGGRRSLAAWCVYDFANTAFGTVIITFVYSVFFARVVAGDETQGNILWNYAIGVSGLFIALLSPVLGALADHYGARKNFVVFFTAVFAAATSMLWFGQAGDVFYVLVIICIANIAYELSIVFYNAMLPHVAPADKIGRVSGFAWGLGYFGGLLCLAAALLMFIGIGDAAPLVKLPHDNHEHMRAVALLTTAWVVVFTLPFLLFTKDSKRGNVTMREAVGRGLRQLRQSVKDMRGQGNLVRFLAGSALYRDGLNTLFTAGAIYAGSAMGLSFQEVLLFGIGINVTAGIGAMAFGILDDRIGPKATIMLSLAGLCAFAAAILLVQDKTVFMACALALGIFIGPAQSAGRTWAARLSPPAMMNQTFGLYALTGKAVSFMGPLCFALAADAFDSQRAGMATIILFWLAGMALLAFVNEKGERKTS